MTTLSRSAACVVWYRLCISELISSCCWLASVAQAQHAGRRQAEHVYGKRGAMLLTVP